MKLKELRKQSRMTQQALANKAGIAISTVANIEAGKVLPNWATIRVLAQALNVDAEELQRHLREAHEKTG